MNPKGNKIHSDSGYSRKKGDRTTSREVTGTRASDSPTSERLTYQRATHLQATSDNPPRNDNTGSTNSRMRSTASRGLFWRENGRHLEKLMFFANIFEILQNLNKKIR